MSQNITSKIPVSKRFFPALLPIVGDETYQQIMTRYRDLYSSHALPQNPFLQRHLVEGILPGLAFYQIIRERGEAQEDALMIIDRAFERLFSDNTNKMKRIGSLPFIYPLLRLSIKPIMRPYPPEGWKLEWVQNDKNAIRFNMKSCFYYVTLSKYDAAELTASFCRVDDLIYENMSPDLVWQRTMTIGRGDTYCDFCFARAPKPQKS
jgi:hypothetical protein